MSQTPPQDGAAQPEPSPELDRESGSRSRAGIARIAVWTAAVLAMLAWLAVGSVSATWYRYNAFTQRTNRLDERRGIVEIWSDWMNNLPESGGEWALSAVFVGTIAAVVVAVIWGAWLLLVSSGDLHPRLARSRER